MDQIFRNIGYDKIKDELVSHIQSLAKTASEQPYYKWNQTWTRSTQEAVSLILIRSWVSTELLLKPTEISELLSGMLPRHCWYGFISYWNKTVPVGEVTKDSFHISTEEYLLAVITLIEELSRLARNAVTIGEYGRPLAISRFIKDIHAGFQTLNLKNDILRKRSDGIKYRLKDVEDVVYDLSLRNLLPKTTPV